MRGRTVYLQANKQMDWLVSINAIQTANGGAFVFV